MVDIDSAGHIAGTNNLHLNSGVPVPSIQTFPIHSELARNMCKLLKLIVEDAPSISNFEMEIHISSGETPRLTMGFLMGKTVIETTAFISKMSDDEQLKLLTFFKDDPHSSIAKTKEAISFVFDAEVIQTIYIKTKDETQVIHPNLAFGVEI